MYYLVFSIWASMGIVNYFLYKSIILQFLEKTWTDKTRIIAIVSSLFGPLGLLGSLILFQYYILVKKERNNEYR